MTSTSGTSIPPSPQTPRCFGATTWISGDPPDTKLISAAAFDIAESTDADALLKRAQALEAAGKYDDAGAAYQSAGDAFKSAGRNTEWSSALRKSAEMYEKEADQLTNGGTPAKAAPPATRAVTRPKEAALSPVRAHSVRLPPLSPRPGYIIGRAITEDGRPIAHFQVSATGFDGQVNLLAGSPSLGAAEGRAGRYALQVWGR